MGVKESVASRVRIVQVYGMRILKKIVAEMLAKPPTSPATTGK